MLVGKECKSDGTDCDEKYIDGVYDSTPLSSIIIYYQITLT
jgi:hypothetical protein